MPLLFNGEPLSKPKYDHLINKYAPKGKEKAVSFVLTNAQPLLRFTERGEKTMERGGTRPLSTSCIARIDGIDGELTYYESKGTVQGKDGKTEVNYEPKYVYFTAHEMTVDAGKNEALFAYLLLNAENERNAHVYGRMPSFKMVDTSEPLKRNVVRTNEKLEAYDLVREAWKSNKSKVKALYQNLGKTDYQELLDEKNYDAILAPIYSICESNPARIIELLNSASLDVGAVLTQALELGVIKEDKLAFYWADTGKRIWAIPAGRDDGFELFVNYVRLEDKSGIFDRIKKDVALKSAVS